jgi:histidinol-phosphate phosphatase family protein
MEKVIFIDRDGVINVDLMGDYVKEPGEFSFEKGAVDALLMLQNAGYKIIIISNQAGVGEGIFSEEALKEVHQHMLDELNAQGVEIHDAFYCLHGKHEVICNCRKPKTGLFEQASEVIDYDKDQTYFIGDKATDIEAGKNFDLKTLFVRTGHGIEDEKKLTDALLPDLKADNLLEGAKLILATERHQSHKI